MRLLRHKAMETLRKPPQQQRAKATVDTILEASARVLHEQGEAGLTTNRVAERAGFSIGTLYQYFPNKRAILTALAERETARVVAKVEAEIAALDPADPEPAVRAMIRSLVGAFGGRQGVRRSLLLMAAREMPELISTPARLAEPLLTALAARAAGMRHLDEAERFVLLRAIFGVVRSAAIERSALLGTPAFEDALVGLALRFARQGAGDPPALP